MRILKLWPALLALALCAAGCGKGPAGAGQSAFTWKMEPVQTVWSGRLHTVQQSTQYDGTAIETEYEKIPQAGNVFLLVELRVYKEAAGGPAFCWDDVALEEKDGGAYPRLADGFLLEFGYDRLPGTELRLKENRGWVCFQVPEGLKEQGWALTHSSGEGENRVPLPADTKEE